MIRWRFILPRVLLVAAILLIIRYALPPAVRYVTVSAIESATGAKVEMASVEVGLFPPRVRYRELQIANPGENKSMSNLAQAESVDLIIDGAALLRRRYVIHDARITGLQFDSDRSTSGHIEREPKPESAEPSMAMKWLSGWMNSAVDSAKSQVDSLVENSETRRRGDQIRRRWKTEYESLAKRAEDLEIAIKDVHQTAKGIENPLRDWPRVDATLTKARSIQEELVAVRKTLDAMPAQVQSDILSMEKAKQTDLQRAREALPFDLAEGEKLGPGLLVQTVRKQINTMRGYLDTGREVSEWTVAKPKVERCRGELVDLEKGNHLPTILVRRCEVAGALRADGKQYTLAGILENLTPQSKLLNDPMRARIRLQGEQTIRLDYARDNSGEIANESLTMHWPEIQAPTMRLGSNDALDLAIRDGKLELWVQLNTSGDQIQGRLVSRRLGTRIELGGPEKVLRTPLFTSLQNSLASVDRIEIDTNFVGTWNDPEFKINSNLTEVLQSGVREATAGQIAATRQKMESEVNRVYADQVGQLQSWLASQQVKTNELLAKADNTVQDISRKVMSETSKADAYLGRLRGNLPMVK
ncbi:MAG TPA: TIGR03545 family protein [Planctomycetaceae bacterium]|nr:TIGR03545 family protein [Planctomycetaceae bacterium]